MRRLKGESNEIRRQPIQTGIKCPLCGSNHWLSQCLNFKGKSLHDRFTFVRSKGLCINCLVAGHVANACPKASFCRVTGCKGVHSSYLHPKSARQANESAKRPASAEGEASKQAGVQDVLNGYGKGENEPRNSGNINQTSATGLAVIPVKVKAPGRKRP